MLPLLFQTENGRRKRSTLEDMRRQLYAFFVVEQLNADQLFIRSDKIQKIKGNFYLGQPAGKFPELIFAVDCRDK